MNGVVIQSRIEDNLRVKEPIRLDPSFGKAELELPFQVKVRGRLRQNQHLLPGNRGRQVEERDCCNDRRYS